MYTVFVFVYCVCVAFDTGTPAPRHDINAVHPCHRVDADGTQHFIIDDEDGDAEHIHETVLSCPTQQIRKITVDLCLADAREPNGSSTILRAFCDEGASCMGCGAEMGALLEPFRYAKCATSISAGGMDAAKTGKYYRSNIR